MKRCAWLAILAALSLAVFGCGDGGRQQQEQTTPAPAETAGVVTDIARSVPDQVDLILENDYVRVAGFHLAPGDSLPPHHGRDRVVYSLNDYRIRFTAEGATGAQDMAAGQVHWHDAGDHSIVNIGETEARFVVFERKRSRLLEAPVRGEEQDITHIAPDHSEVIFENDHARLMSFVLAPGAVLPSHEGTGRVMYALTDVEVKFIAGEEQAATESFAVGEAHWHDMETHSVENIGAAEARYLVCEWKN